LDAISLNAAHSKAFLIGVRADFLGGLDKPLGLLGIVGLRR
jgi:hypothetical protein